MYVAWGHSLGIIWPVTLIASSFQIFCLFMKWTLIHRIFLSLFFLLLVLLPEIYWVSVVISRFWSAFCATSSSFMVVGPQWLVIIFRLSYVIVFRCYFGLTNCKMLCSWWLGIFLLQFQITWLPSFWNWGSLPFIFSFYLRVWWRRLVCVCMWAQHT